MGAAGTFVIALTFSQLAFDTTEENPALRI